MKSFFAVVVACLASLSCMAQKEEVYSIVDEMPSFPGGEEALKAYLTEAVRYPNVEDCVSGRILVSFIIMEDGSVGQVKVERSLHPAFDAEAVRVVSNMPKWATPGMKDGKPVRVKYTVPVKFALY